ncbi:competence protein CoiA [Massilia sp. BKSP1R2A-1]|uniref:competence protein CoiA n=1 Tax=Massilia sp. BKSP1R2A-1 TaxID=3422595 RepID=UPI003D329B3C
MLYAWVGDQKRAPTVKGERTTCRDCGSLLTAVMPVENTPHWRHKAGDCDPWSEPEGPWHLGWKELFDMSCREIALRDKATGELHRADILVGSGTSRATVLELQHSSINEDERNAREAFYRSEHRMFWLVHIHDESSFLRTYFGMSLDFSSRVVNLDGKEFAVMHWMGPNKQFIEKWKRATAHVFFHAGSHIFYLAGPSVAARLGGPFQRGEFALCVLKRDDFLRAVHWEDSVAPTPVVS